MRQFKVWLLGQGAISLQQDLYFEFSDSSVFMPMRSALQETATEFRHCGLEYQVMSEADDQKTAFLKAIWSCSVVADLLSIAHAVSIPPPIPFVAIERTTDGGPRLFGQVARDLPLSVRPKRFFKPNEFSVIFAAWDAVDANARERLARAVSLLRRSYAETDPIDRFEDIWNGLETVNPLLRKKHNLPDWYEGSPCPSCGEKTRVPGSSSGIRHAVLELAGGRRDDWRGVRDLRQRIVHGLGALSEAIPSLNQHLPLLRRALLRGIAALLNLPEDAAGPAMREPLAMLQGPEVLLTATLDGVPDDCLQDSSRLPFFTIRFEEVDVSDSPSASEPRRVTFNVTSTPNNLTGTYSNPASELLVHVDPEDHSATLVMRGQSVIRAPEA